MVILGAGLAGLSAAYQAQKAGKAALLFEAQSRPGGLVRSERVNGFTFDYTGHLLHMREGRTQALVNDELGLKALFAPVQRDSWVYAQGRFTRAPYQANLHGQPLSVVRECLEGALQAHGALPAPAKAAAKRALARGFHSFEDFNLAAFGPGIYRHFMEPYNLKLWGVHPSRMSTEFMGRFVPKPGLRQIFEGALFDVGKPLGYNANFIYPKAGGIEVLARGLASKVEAHCGLEAMAIDPKRREVSLSDGQVVGYSRLVSTLQLPDLVARTKGAPGSVRAAAKRLRAASVLNVNFGVAGRNITAMQWAYVPETSLPFYRVGFYHNFSAALAPRGGSSVYAELSYSDERPIDKRTAPAQVKAGLMRMGLLRKDDKIAAQWVADIRNAYVTYDAHRTRSVGLIQDWLKGLGIRSVGRWGNWEYAAMEDAIWQGADAVL
jgi:protoporphyrinogen oxidase